MNVTQCYYEYDAYACSTVTHNLMFVMLLQQRISLSVITVCYTSYKYIYKLTICSVRDDDLYNYMSLK